MTTKINPGSLRTPIIIKRLVDGKDEDKRPCKKLESIYQCKAKVESYTGKQDLEAQGKVYIDEKKVIFRIPKIEIFDTDIITINERNYDITSIIDLDERKRFYQLKVRFAK